MNLVLFTLLLTLSLLQAGLVSEAQVKEETGSLTAFLTKLKSTIFPQGSERYVEPTNRQLESMRKLVKLILTSLNSTDPAKLLEAKAAGSHIEYELIRFRDLEYNRAFLIAREMSATARGWGTYIFCLANDRSSHNLVIEVPHPLFDMNTLELASLSFIRSESLGLLIAGAHRYANNDRSSDVPWAKVSMFEVVHEVLAEGRAVTIQIHGFELRNDRTGYPQIVLSSGNKQRTRALENLATQLSKQGFTVGIADEIKYGDLSGGNRQASYSRKVGATFIHMETERSIRMDPSQYPKVSDAVIDYLQMPDTGDDFFASSTVTIASAVISMLGIICVIFFVRRHFQARFASM